jgi:hypothetical protein
MQAVRPGEMQRDPSKIKTLCLNCQPFQPPEPRNFLKPAAAPVNDVNPAGKLGQRYETRRMGRNIPASGNFYACREARSLNCEQRDLPGPVFASNEN